MKSFIALITTGMLLAQDQPRKAAAEAEAKARAAAQAAEAAQAKPNVTTPGVPKPEVPKPEVSKPKLPGIGKPKVNRDVARVGKLKEAAIGVPTGSPLTVAVKGADGKTEKLFGRMGNVTNDGFTMQTVSGGDLQERQLSFSDVSSMKQGPKQSKLQQIRGPLLGVMSLMTLAGTVIAIVRR